MIFNTHSHINDAKDKIDEQIEHLLYNNVKYCAAVGYDLDSSKRALDLANNKENIYAICGIQPCEINNFNGEYDKLREYLNDPKCIGIGEIGLDYYYGKDDKERQLIIFEEQLKIACNYKKPVIIHCRDAYLDTYNLLDKYKDRLDGIILHCYSGSVEMMQRFLLLGAYISFSGVVTFKNAKEIKEVALLVPEDRMLVETDDPYLTPVPHRGEINEPSNVIYVVQEIAKIKGKSYDEVANQTTLNAKKVFHL